MFIGPIIVAAILTQSPSGLGDATTKARPAPSVGSSEAAARLIAKRRAKRAAAYVARLDREAREAQEQAAAAREARAEFERTLPARVALNGQMLARQSQFEANQVAAQRNAILNQYLNGGGAQGVIYGPPPSPPRIVNMPGQPLANP